LVQGDLSEIVATTLVVVALIWAMNRYLGRRRSMPPDLDRPYFAFTTDFDVTCSGHEVPQILRDRGAAGLVPANTVHASVDERIAIAEEAYASGAADLPLVEEAMAAAQGTLAVAILVDQSGSMVNRMPDLAGRLRAVVEGLERAGIPTALLGFTTCGWRGGKSRKKWMRAGRPAYPGRLCDLLHIVYKDFDGPLDDADWRTLLHADALFENLDGEALAWGRSRLEARAEANRLLILVSDGAPVDDSTLSENGATFLERHLLTTIDDIAEHSAVQIGAIGIGHRVDRYYATSETVERAEGFPPAFSSLVGKLLAKEPG
jgi:cobaltochelatase CobT